VNRRITLVLVGWFILSTGLVVGLARWGGVFSGMAAGEAELPSKPIEHRIDINTASVRVLDKLPGIGPELVERIMRHPRTRNLTSSLQRRSWAESSSRESKIASALARPRTRVLDGVGTGDDGVIAHEIQHYLQYSYDDGCYDDFQPLYPGSSLIEGWANWAGKNATSAALDASYSVSSYNAGSSYYDLSYTNLKQGYDIQQYGGNGAPADPGFGINEVYEHYRKCDVHDSIFAFDETISALTGGVKK
jgi:hypothetical protein